MTEVKTWHVPTENEAAVRHFRDALDALNVLHGEMEGRGVFRDKRTRGHLLNLVGRVEDHLAAYAVRPQ